LDYGLLLRTLDINEERELDELIIDSIYSGIIEGKINQKERLFKVKNEDGWVKYNGFFVLGV